MVDPGLSAGSTANVKPSSHPADRSLPAASAAASATSPSGLELPPDYYLDNFTFLVEFVQRHYPDVLAQTESDFARTFLSLPLDARRLYVRLSGRKGPVFRLDKLRYPEIANLDESVQQLVATGLLARNPEIDPGSLLELATKNELLASFEISGRGLKRPEIADQVLLEHPDYVQISARLGYCYVQPLKMELVQVFKLLFFGNLRQDFSDFVLRDLGISPIESYVMDPSGRYFDDRQTLNGMLTCYALRDQAEECLAENCPNALLQLAGCLLDFSPQDEVIHFRFSRILNRVARQLERLEQPGVALALYEQSQLPPARERRARILAQAGQVAEALALCEQINDEPQDEAEYEFAQQFGRRLVKKHQLPKRWLDEPPAERPVIDDLVLENDPSERVEQLAVTWFLAQGWNAYYVENGLLNSLFGLYFWPVIFASVKGAFFNPLQRGPADLFSAEFRLNRRPLIEHRLAQMNDAGFVQSEIQRFYQEKFGISNHFVAWGQLSAPLLSTALSRIPVSDLKLIFQRFLRDLKLNRAGLPDLIVFPPDTAGYDLVEVKGPGDTLQKNQQRWFRFFHQARIPARILNISWV